MKIENIWWKNCESNLLKSLSGNICCKQSVWQRVDIEFLICSIFESECLISVASVCETNFLDSFADEHVPIFSCGFFVRNQF